MILLRCDTRKLRAFCFLPCMLTQASFVSNRFTSCAPLHPRLCARLFVCSNRPARVARNRPGAARAGLRSAAARQRRPLLFVLFPVSFRGPPCCGRGRSADKSLGVQLADAAHSPPLLSARGTCGCIRSAESQINRAVRGLIVSRLERLMQCDFRQNSHILASIVCRN